jgi:hypothetical protein
MPTPEKIQPGIFGPDPALEDDVTCTRHGGQIDDGSITAGRKGASSVNAQMARTPQPELAGR